jgi:hypothetical protein
MKHLLNLRTLFFQKTLSKGLCCGILRFHKPHVVPKNVLTVGYDMYTGENQSMTEQESSNRNSYVVVGTVVPKYEYSKKKAEMLYLRYGIYLFNKVAIKF